MKKTQIGIIVLATVLSIWGSSAYSFADEVMVIAVKPLEIIPAEKTITVGTKLTFSNNDPLVAHIVQGPNFETDAIRHAGVDYVTFDEVGTYAITLKNYPGVSAVINVVEEAPQEVAAVIDTQQIEQDDKQDTINHLEDQIRTLTKQLEQKQRELDDMKIELDFHKVLVSQMIDAWNQWAANLSI